MFGEEKTWQKPPCSSLALKPGVRICSDSSTSHRVSVTVAQTAPAVLAPACSQPDKVHLPTLALLWRGSQLQLQRGAQDMKREVLQFHGKECISSSSVAGLCCTAGQDCAEHTGMSWPFRLLSHVAAAQGCALWPPAQPALASSDGPGHTSVQSSSRGIQSDSTAASWFLSSRHLPLKSLCLPGITARPSSTAPLWSSTVTLISPEERQV